MSLVTGEIGVIGTSVTFEGLCVPPLGTPRGVEIPRVVVVRTLSPGRYSHEGKKSRSQVFLTLCGCGPYHQCLQLL